MYTYEDHEPTVEELKEAEAWLHEGLMDDLIREIESDLNADR